MAMSDLVSELASIKATTRVALPAEDAYLYRLGVATYGFAYVTNFVLEITGYLEPGVDHTALRESTAGSILDRFRQAAKAWAGPSIKPHAVQAGDGFQRLNTERSDFIHGYPITNGDGEQILYRSVDAKGKRFEVTSAFLDDFIARLELVVDELYAIRAIVRPGL